MRYIVTVEAQIFHTQEVVVEAATENEASQSAVAIITSRAFGDIRQIDVVSIKESPRPESSGYISRIL